MASLNGVPLHEVFDHRRSSHLMRSYNEQEGAIGLPPYQLDIKFSRNVSRKKEQKLIEYMIKSLGYDRCAVDRQNNTITISSTESANQLNPTKIMKYIKKHIDDNACETQDQRPR